ncbi:MAG: VWA domain-containing protein [Candidatus Saccharimonadales bacterium]
MVLAQPQVILLWILLAIAIFVIIRKFGGRLGLLLPRVSGRRLPAAHAERLSNLPSYQSVAGRYRKMLQVACGGMILLLVCSVLLTARPSRQDIVSPAQKNRDIMLCLDISGSMLPVVRKVFEKFAQLVNDFEGQRIGLTVFNSSASTVVPLSDDYNVLKEELELGKVAFSVEKPAFESEGSDIYKAYRHFTAGVNAVPGASSLIGTSLATCVKRLGANETKRAQSIIFATDNEADKQNEIITTPQSMALAKQKNIRVYALDPGKDFYANIKGDHAELKVAATSTGGGYYALDNPSAVSSVIDQISKQEATLFAGKSQIARTDKPAYFVVAALVGLLALAVMAWRLRI